jgi:hypothetical protein
MHGASLEVSGHCLSKGTTILKGAAFDILIERLKPS